MGASSCNPTKWCAALNIDSLSLNPVTGKANNPTCLSKVGEEYVNFAFITKNGKAQAPANPVDSTLATFTPSSKDLYMNSGDHLSVAFTDTKNGLKVSVNDLTTGAKGSVTASAANGFAQVKYAPTGSSCTAIPYDFHPMYATSNTKTRDLWPNGNTLLHPTAFQFSSPEFGPNYTEQYQHAAFETDLPVNEPGCDVNTGSGCTIIPQTDDGTPAQFYPFYTDTKTSSGCVWQFGNDIPGEISDFGQDVQYGTLLQQSYTTKGGGSSSIYTDFRNILSNNPCT